METIGCCGCNLQWKQLAAAADEHSALLQPVIETIGVNMDSNTMTRSSFRDDALFSPFYMMMIMMMMMVMMIMMMMTMMTMLSFPPFLMMMMMMMLLLSFPTFLLMMMMMMMMMMMLSFPPFWMMMMMMMMMMTMLSFPPFWMMMMMTTMMTMTMMIWNICQNAKIQTRIDFTRLSSIGRSCMKRFLFHSHYCIRNILSCYNSHLCLIV